MKYEKVKINRAPVLTLWAAVVAQRTGYKRDEALTLAKALTGLTAQSRGRALGIFHPADKEEIKKKPRKREVKGTPLQFLGRQLNIVKTKDGVRAVSGGVPIKPESVEKYLHSKFGDALEDTQSALQDLARSVPPKELAQRAYALYGQFTPKVPSGTQGWGAKGELDLKLVRSLAKRKTE